MKPPANAWWTSPRIWVAFAMCVGLLPFWRGLTGTHVFYIRDLSLFFWGRDLWLRRTLLSGDWPLWDPYMGGGQSAVADGLHQMFLPPALVARLIGGEVLGFNLWVALPFPLAALGAHLFFSRRFSARASALGSIAFAVSGPIVSSGNFPNMSWSVAALPWVLWAADRAVTQTSPKAAAVLALAVGCQALAGEPVSMVATLVVCAGFVLIVSLPDVARDGRMRARALLCTACGTVLGLLLAAIQLIPMRQAASASMRTTLPAIGSPDFWSLHPLALVETVSLHVFGDYFSSQSLASLPWMPLLNGGREPFFFSLYIGVPLLVLAAVGAIATPRRRWSLFWAVSGLVGLVCGFGGYTPIYPYLRAHLPLLSSFRFPVKYIVVTAFAVAAEAAAGWDAMSAPGPASEDTSREARRRAGRIGATAFALGIGVLAYVAAGACLYLPRWTALQFFTLARALPITQGIVPDPVGAAEFMLRALPQGATAVLLIALASALLVWMGNAQGREASMARAGLYVFIVADLVIRAWGLNPAFDPRYLREPEWLAKTRADADARIYVGGKRDGTLDPGDLDGSRAFLNPPGLTGSASRAALSNEAVFFSSAWHAREMLSYDLPVLWPRLFASMTNRFLRSDRADRDRFLDRTGVRYRVLATRQAGGRTPVMPVPYFYESSLYDWGPVAPRAAVLPAATLMPDIDRQLEMLFEPGWDSDRVALVERDTPEAGKAAAPAEPAAQVSGESSNHVSVSASAGASGGYLLLRDSYADGWRATVDGQRAEISRADGLFRAVHLAPGRHAVEFRYMPQSFLWGAGISGAALLALVALSAWPRTPWA